MHVIHITVTGHSALAPWHARSPAPPVPPLSLLSQARDANLAANMAELDATLSSPFMTEDPMLAASSMSAYRVRKDHFKVRAACGWACGAL